MRRLFCELLLAKCLFCNKKTLVFTMRRDKAFVDIALDVPPDSPLHAITPPAGDGKSIPAGEYVQGLGARAIARQWQTRQIRGHIF